MEITHNKNCDPTSTRMKSLNANTDLPCAAWCEIEQRVRAAFSKTSLDRYIFLFSFGIRQRHRMFLRVVGRVPVSLRHCRFLRRSQGARLILQVASELNCTWYSHVAACKEVGSCLRLDDKVFRTRYV